MKDALKHAVFAVKTIQPTTSPQHKTKREHANGLAEKWKDLFIGAIKLHKIKELFEMHAL